MVRPWMGKLYVQVLIGIVVGLLLGLLAPNVAVTLQPLADGFIKLIKMLLAPIIFGTIVVGIAKMGNIKEVGRIGVRALIYFEVVSTIALVIGLVVVNVVQPGAGMNIDRTRGSMRAPSPAMRRRPRRRPASSASSWTSSRTTMVDAFAKGAMLQIILISVLLGVCLRPGSARRGKPVVDRHRLPAADALFRIVAMVMRLAPIGAGAGVAFTIGKLRLGHGVVARLADARRLHHLDLVFVVVVLGSIARWTGFPLLHFLRYFKDEILITLGTCSTEAVLPRMMAKLERLGCERPWSVWSFRLAIPSTPTGPAST